MLAQPWSKRAWSKRARPELDGAMLAEAWRRAMRQGDFDTAWLINDAVLAGRDPATRDDPTLPYHLRWVWDGRAFDGKRVLVRCYHGLGDTLQFCRYLPLLRRRAAAVTLEVQPELAGLLAGLPGPDRIIPFRLDAPAPPSECDIEIMELGHALRAAPPASPYLKARPAPRPVPALQPIKGRRSIGLCWEAGEWDSGRSVKLGDLLATVRMLGVDLYTLQRGPGVALGAHAASFANPIDRSMDVERTATLLMTLDLVVSVDTMVAHLAGALGRPTRLLLKAEADWRWMERRSDSVWYRSMRLLRQDSPGDWRGVLTRLKAEITALL